MGIPKEAQSVFYEKTAPLCVKQRCTSCGEVLGKPQKWTRKTFSRMRRKVYENTGVLMEIVEGQSTMDFSFDDEPKPGETPAAGLQPAPAVNCEGLSDTECGAAFRAASQ